jgi:peptidoglycan/LPS O-acetylase OafA/YrhL
MGRSSVGPASDPRLPGIEGLRALAASCIVVYHTWVLGSPGGAADLGLLSRTVFPHLTLGVTLFFTLSGFLLYRPFAGALLRGQRRPSFAAYLWNRTLRILPAYWFILLIAALALRAVFVRESPFDLDTAGFLQHPRMLVANLFLIQNYHPVTYFTGIGPAWSVAIEVVFYVALPLLVLLAWALARGASSRSGRRMAAFAPAVVLLLIGLSGKAAATYLVRPEGGIGWVGWSGNWNSVLERSFWAQADLFAFGLALAVIRIDWEDGLLRLPSWWRKAVAMAAVVITLITVRLANDGRLGTHKYATVMAFVCGLFLALIALAPAGSGRQPWLVRMLRSRVLFGVGLASYSLFLWHEPLIRWMNERGVTLPGAGGFAANLALVALVGGAFSALTYRFVEKPALRRKARTTARIPGSQPTSVRVAENSSPVPEHQSLVTLAGQRPAGEKSSGTPGVELLR